MPSGERTGFEAPPVVMAFKEGTEGKRVADARVTISACRARVFFQGW